MPAPSASRSASRRASSTPIRSGRSSPARRCSTSSSRSRTGSPVGRGAAGDDPEPGRRHAQGRRRARRLRRLARRSRPRRRLRPLADELRRDADRPEVERRPHPRRLRDARSSPPSPSAASPCSASAAACQLMNVALGGTLLQDIDTQRPGAVRHRDAVLYDRNLHTVEFEPGRGSRAIFEGTRSAHDQQRPPPGHQGPRARLRRRGALPGRRHDRGDPPPRQARTWRRCSGTPSFTGAAKARSTTGHCSTTSSPRRAPHAAHEPAQDHQPGRRHAARRGPGRRRGRASPPRRRVRARRSPHGQAVPLGERERGHRALPRRRRRPSSRRSRATLTAGGRQADRAVAQRAERLPRPDRLLPGRGRARRPAAETVSSTTAAMTRAHRPRPARRRRQHLGLELSVLRRRQRLRAGAPDRQRGALQAVRVRHADGTAHRPPAARCRHSRRRLQSRSSARGEVGAALLAQRRRRRLLHRLVRDRREDRRRRAARA